MTSLSEDEKGGALCRLRETAPGQRRSRQLVLARDERVRTLVGKDVVRDNEAVHVGAAGAVGVAGRVVVVALRPRRQERSLHLVPPGGRLQQQ